MLLCFWLLLTSANWAFADDNVDPNYTANTPARHQDRGASSLFAPIEPVIEPTADSQIPSAVKTRAQPCLEESKKRDQRYNGRVEMDATITKATVTSVVIIKNDTGDPLLSDCLQERLPKTKVEDEKDETQHWVLMQN